MKIEGRIWKFGSDVDTDAIIAARYLNQTDARELAKHAMEDERPEFAREVKKGDLVLAEKNFGCGSSREHAPLAIKALGISCVVAKTFARIFYRNAFNIGLPILECADASEQIEEGHEIEVNIDTGVIQDLTAKKSLRAKSIPPFMQELIKQGGLMSYVSKRISK